ncbi:MAG: group II intron reverse transcriptase/maturase [Lewinellaceae bacterium]|nr:group II intron reverse transcriptase/maturase [Lewinellaceae bacterium]
MIEQLLKRENLNRAYVKVVRNQGAGGVDGLQVSDLKDFLRDHGSVLIESVRSGSYQPQPIKGVAIPKSNGKTRLLGVPTVADRVLQQALTQVLEPLFEPDFRPFSYGFRPGRNAQQAVIQAQAYINEGYQYIVDIDLKNFFDEVDHVLLLNLIYKRVKCKMTLCLLRRYLRAPILLEGKLHKRRKGVPQGAPLSPLLSNILLHELDKELEKRNLRYVRYADDFSVYVGSKKAARRVGNGIFKYLRDRLHLPINREKSGIRRPVNFELLGYGFVSSYEKGSKGKYQLVVSRKKWESLKAMIKTITRKTIPMTFDERVQRLNWLIRGWINYFKLASIHGKLKKLDEWVRNRLRYCIWHHWKKPDRKRKNLIRLGVDQNAAYAWSRTRLGGWRVAQSPILGTTVTIARLKSRGYFSLVEYYLLHRSS